MKIMNNLIRLFFCLCVFGGTSIYCYAEELTAVTLTMDQSFVDLDGASYPAEAEVTYLLTADTPDSPMPVGSVGGQYRFNLKGNSSGVTAPILFEHAGIFSYQLQASIPDSFPYQGTPPVYYIQVYVKNDGNSLMSVYNQERTKVSAMSAVYTSPTRRVIADQNVREDNRRIPDTRILSGNVPANQATSRRSLPRTGDSSQTIIWRVLGIICLMGVLIVQVKKESRSQTMLIQNRKKGSDE
ncbi:hypothetical protein JZO70_13725 [Enterococcus sp. 669A]|uniref:Streptococcal pilin isopeptide linker domain-containing protein n=1 Tax=Candidatus Enterococcus moelleringii TaxID=2815325 RepID=A0ABS3LER8_9ENTE|nr:hypothetical protein [Enterococcus sp. 669A]MBO1307231.1 hypothetical protein [Enterococcus sp. 669A]